VRGVRGAIGAAAHRDWGECATCHRARPVAAAWTALCGAAGGRRAATAVGALLVALLGLSTSDECMPAGGRRLCGARRANGHYGTMIAAERIRRPFLRRGALASEAGEPSYAAGGALQWQAN